MKHAAVAVICVTGLALVGAAAAEGPVLSGSVGPGFSISLRDAAASPVTQLSAGPAMLEVNDQSEEHNFHLTGPGVDVSTSVEEIGKKSFQLALADGTYQFVCDPHSARMRGQFTVGAGGGSGGTGGTGGTGGGGGTGGTTGTPSAAVGSTLVATAGPGFTITLKTKAGKRVTRLKPGRYTILARDRSSAHNVHLVGAGINKSTTVPGTGTRTWKVVLKKGTLVFVCDPHKSSMRGTVKIAP